MIAATRHLPIEAARTAGSCGRGFLSISIFTVFLSNLAIFFFNVQNYSFSTDADTFMRLKTAEMVKKLALAVVFY